MSDISHGPVMPGLSLCHHRGMQKLSWDALVDHRDSPAAVGEPDPLEAQPDPELRALWDEQKLSGKHSRALLWFSCWGSSP